MLTIVLKGNDIEEDWKGLVFRGTIYPPYDQPEDPPYGVWPQPGQTVTWREKYLGDNNEKQRNYTRNRYGYTAHFKVTRIFGDLVEMQSPRNELVVVPRFWIDYNNVLGHDG